MREQIDDWVKVVAHEMRNPLAAIGAGLRLLTKHGAHGRFAADVSERMEQQLHQLVRLVNDLTDERQVAQRHFSVCRERLALSLVLERAIETTRSLIQDLGHDLSVGPCPDTVIVNGDADRLTQVFVNLLENAAYYTRRGGHIAIETERIAAGVVVRVQDDGTGIPADLLPRVFEMHTRGSEQARRRSDGAGIGLTIVRNIVEAHGGGVAVTSAGAGKGSTFLVELPTVTDGADN